MMILGGRGDHNCYCPRRRSRRRRGLWSVERDARTVKDKKEERKRQPRRNEK